MERPAAGRLRRGEPERREQPRVHPERRPHHEQAHLADDRPVQRALRRRARRRDDAGPRLLHDRRQARGELHDRIAQALRHGISSYLGTGEILGVNTAGFTFDTQRDFAIGTAEIQQIFAADHHTLLAGVRYQEGDFETTSMLSVIRPTFAGAFTSPAVAQQLTSHFERLSVYGYDYLKPTRWLTLTGGLAWDRIEHPDNFRNPPVNALQQEDERLSGKFGFTLAPSRWVTLRGAYTEGMGGVTFDESVRLEPVQISGFNQAYRTVISESIAGSVETPLIRTGGLSLEGQLPTHTWWNVGLNAIEQDVDRTLGVFDGYDITLFPISPAYFPSGTRQELDYQEASLSASLNQLIGRGFSVGAGYGVTRSELRTHFTEFPTLLVPLADVTDEATLRQLRLFAHWNSPTGLFARLEANWFSQELIDDPQRTALSGIHREGEDFWQCNAMLGYRFHRSTCEISAGLINIAGHNYHLSPLTPHPDMERGQTVVLRCRLSF